MAVLLFFSATDELNDESNGEEAMVVCMWLCVCVRVCVCMYVQCVCVVYGVHVVCMYVVARVRVIFF